MLQPRFLRKRRRLDRKITLQKMGAGRDAMNAPTEDWQDQFSTRAKAYPSPGFERSISDGSTATSPMTFEVKDCEQNRTIEPSWRVMYNGRAYNIVAPVDQPERGGNLRIITAADR